MELARGATDAMKKFLVKRDIKPEKEPSLESTIHDERNHPVQVRNNDGVDHPGSRSSSSVKKMLAESRRQYLEKSRIHNKLRQEHSELLKRRQELIRDHEALRQDNQELRQEIQELRRERRGRQEQYRSHQDLQREFGTLNEEFQELLCVHDEVKQELANVISDSKQVTKELEDDVALFESRYHYIDKMIILPYAKRYGLEYDDLDVDDMDRVLKPLKSDAMSARALQRQVDAFSKQHQKSEAEFTALQNQVQALQNELLSRVEKVHAVSDEQFAQEFRAIIAHVKSFGRSVRPNPDSDILGILDSGLLLLHTSEDHWKVRRNQKYHIEAWIWSVLLEHVFATPFAIFGEASSVFEKAWVLLYGAGLDANKPFPSASCESFRCTVFDELIRLAGQETVLSGQDGAYVASNDLARYLAQGAFECRERVANVIGSKLAAISSTLDVYQIVPIVNQSFALALKMSSQKCRLQVTYPTVGDAFHSGVMSSLPDLDGEDLQEGNVAFIINPGLSKWGDAHGKLLDERYDIVPSLVQLQPPKPSVSEQDGRAQMLIQDRLHSHCNMTEATNTLSFD